MFPYHDGFFELVEIYMMKIFSVEQMYWLLTSALPDIDKEDPASIYELYCVWFLLLKQVIRKGRPVELRGDYFNKEGA